MAIEDNLNDRRKSLEEEFFRKQDQRLRDQLRAKQRETEAKVALADASGIRDERVLATLVGLGITVSELLPLSLIPLVEVAWADGKIDDKEKEAIVRAAESGGIAKGSPPHEMLESWLATRPDEKLRRAWEHYARAVCDRLSAEDRTALERDVIGRARDVAAAAGGFLGLGSKVSRAEESVLAELSAVLRG